MKNRLMQYKVRIWLAIGTFLLTYLGVLQAVKDYPELAALFVAAGIVVVGADHLKKPIPPDDKGS
jgi:hypothetical protein